MCCNVPAHLQAPLFSRLQFPSTGIGMDRRYSAPLLCSYWGLGGSLCNLMRVTQNFYLCFSFAGVKNHQGTKLTCKVILYSILYITCIILYPIISWPAPEHPVWLKLLQMQQTAKWSCLCAMYSKKRVCLSRSCWLYTWTERCYWTMRNWTPGV